jgi:hypothetical protein
MLLKTVRLHRYEVRFLLSLVKKPSIWQEGIKLQLKKGTKADLDGLIEQLRGQAKDNPAGMREILGSEVYDKLIERC